MSSKYRTSNFRGSSSPPTSHQIGIEEKNIERSGNKINAFNLKDAEANISYLKNQIQDNFKKLDGIGKNLKSASTINKLDLDKVILLASKLKLHTRKQKESFMKAFGYENLFEKKPENNFPIDIQEIEKIDQESKQLEEDLTRIKQNVVKKDNDLSSFIERVLSSRRLQNQMIETIEGILKETNLNYRSLYSNVPNYENLNFNIYANESSSISSARNDSMVSKGNAEKDQKFVYQKRAKELQKANDLLMNQLQTLHDRLSSSKDESEKLKNELLKYKVNKNYMSSSINQRGLNSKESSTKKPQNKAYSLHPSEKSDNGDDSKNSIQTQKGRIKKNVLVTSNQNRNKERIYSAAPSEDSKSDKEMTHGGFRKKVAEIDRVYNNENTKSLKAYESINLVKKNNMEVSPANSKTLSIKNSLKYEKINDENSMLRIQISTIMSKVNSILDLLEIKLDDAYNKACAFDKKIINDLSIDNNKSKIEINSIVQEFFSSHGIAFNVRESSNQENRSMKSKITSNINQREYNAGNKKFNEGNDRGKGVIGINKDNERNSSQKKSRPKPDNSKSNRPASVLQDRIKFLEQEKKEIISKKNNEIYKLSDQIVQLNKQNELNILRIKSQNSNYPNLSESTDRNFLYVSSGNVPKKMNLDRDSYIRKLEEENEKYKELQIEYNSTCQSFYKNEKALKLSILQMKEAVEYKDSEITRLRERMSNEENINEKMESIKIECVKIIQNYSNECGQIFKEFEESIKEKESRINDLSFLLKSYQQTFVYYQEKVSSIENDNMEILKLKEELLAATSNLESYINESKRYEIEIENLQKENSRINDLFINGEIKIQKIESEYQLLSEEIDQERRKHNIEIQKILNEQNENNKNNEVEKLQKKISTLETDYKLKLQTLTKKEKVLNGTIKSKDNELKQAKIQIENTSKELSQKSLEIEALNTEFTKFKEETQMKFIENLERNQSLDASNEYKEKINELISDNKKMAHMLEEKSSEIDKIKKVNVSKDQLVKKLNLTNVKLTSELNNLKNTFSCEKQDAAKTILKPQRFKSGIFKTEINTGFINISRSKELTPLLNKKSKNIPFSPSIGDPLEDQLSLNQADTNSKKKNLFNQKSEFSKNNKCLLCKVNNITIKFSKPEEDNQKLLEIQKINNKLKENINNITTQASKRLVFINSLFEILKAIINQEKFSEYKNKLSNNLKSFQSLGKYEYDEYKNIITAIPEFFDQINNNLLKLESNYIKIEKLTEQNNHLLKENEEAKKEIEKAKQVENQIIKGLKSEKLNLTKMIEDKNNEIKSYQNKYSLLESSFEKAKTEHDSKTKANENSLSHYQSLLDELKLKLNETVKEKEVWSDNAKVLENRCQEKDNKILNQNKELDLVKAGNNDLINKIEMLSNLIEEHNLTIQKRESEIRELQAQVELRRSSGFKTDEAEKSPQENKDNLEKLKLELSSQKENSKGLKTALEEKETEYNHLMSEVIQSNKDKNQYQEANIHLQEEIFKITNELNSMKIQFEEEKNQKKLSDSNSENQNMEFQNLKLDFENIFNDNYALKIQLDEANKEIEKLRKINEKFPNQFSEDNNNNQMDIAQKNLEVDLDLSEKEFQIDDDSKEKIEKIEKIEKLENIEKSEQDDMQNNVKIHHEASKDDLNKNEIANILTICLQAITDFFNQITTIDLDWNSESIQNIKDNFRVMAEYHFNKNESNLENEFIKIAAQFFNIVKTSLDLILSEMNNQSKKMKNYSESLSKIGSELEDYKQQLYNNNNINKKLENDLQNLNKNNSNYISQISIFNKNLKEKEDKLKIKDQEIAKLNSSISTLQLENQNYLEQIKSLQISNAGTSNNEKSKKIMIDNFNNKIEFLEKESKEKDHKINILNSEKGNLSNQIVLMEKSLLSKVNIDEIASLKITNDKLKEENKTISKHMQDLEKRLSELLSDKEKENINLKRNINQNDELNDSSLKVINELIASNSFSNDNLKNLINEFQLKLSNNSFKVDDARSILELLKFAWKKFSQMKTDKVTSYESGGQKEKSKDLDEQQFMLEEKEMDIQLLKSEIHYKDTSLKENEIQIDQLSKYCEDISDTIKINEEKYQILQKENEELKIELEIKSNQIEEYHNQGEKINLGEDKEENMKISIIKLEDLENQINELFQMNADTIRENNDLKSKLEANAGYQSQGNAISVPKQLRLHSEGGKNDTKNQNDAFSKKGVNQSNECSALLKIVNELNIPISLDPAILEPEDYVIVIVNYVEQLNKRASGKSINRPSHHKFNPILINEFDPISESNEGQEDKIESISDIVLNFDTLNDQADIQPSAKLNLEKFNEEGSKNDEAFIVDNDICVENNRNINPESNQINQIKIDYQNQIDLIQIQWEQKVEELNLEKEKINEELVKYKSENEFLKDIKPNMEKPVEDFFDEENDREVSKEAKDKRNSNKEESDILKLEISELQNRNRLVEEELIELKKKSSLIDWSGIKMEDLKVLFRVSYNDNEWILIVISDQYHWLRSNEIPDSILYDILELYTKFLKNEEEQLNERKIEEMEEDQIEMIPLCFSKIEISNILSRFVYYPNYEIDKHIEKVESLTNEILEIGEKNALIQDQMKEDENQNIETNKVDKLRKNQNKTANYVSAISFKSEILGKDKIDVENHQKIVTELNNLREKYNECENKLSLYLEQVNLILECNAKRRN